MMGKIVKLNLTFYFSARMDGLRFFLIVVCFWNKLTFTPVNIGIKNNSIEQFNQYLSKISNDAVYS